MGIRILGTIEVDGVDRALLGGPLQQGVLVDLALNLGAFVHRDRLFQWLWEDPPSSAASTLHGYLSHLRRSLEPTALRIESKQSAYRLLGGPGCLDATEFDNLVLAAEDALAADGGDLELASHRLGAALQLWRGDPMPELAHQPGARVVSERLIERHATAISHLLRLRLLRGGHEGCVPELKSAVESHPFHEELWALLMICLYRCGRQAEALAAYRKIRELLAEEQGLDPGVRLASVERAILRHDPALDGPELLWGPLATRSSPNPALKTEGPILARAAQPRPLPWRSSFVGRQPELALLSRMLAEHPLITLVGPPGVGKSRLAEELTVSPSVRGSESAVRYIDASVLPSDDSLLRAMAAAFHADGPVVTITNVAAAIQGQPSLIIIDGCEHLAAAVGAICVGLLETCAELRIIITSQCALQVRGETVFEVPPLGLFLGPEFDRARVLASAAVKLILDQTYAGAEPDLGDRSLATVNDICQSLDGMPLALELAGAVGRTLSWEDVRDGLAQRFELLARAGPATDVRQTLLGTMEWSYGLLDPTQQRLLRRLGVFAGGFDMDAAQAICGDGRLSGAELAGRLAQLIGRSLVTRLPGAQARPYRLLETVREFARARLERNRSDSKRVRERHAAYFLAYAEAAHPHLFGTDGPTWYSAIHASHPDLTLAADWLGRQGDLQRAAQIAVAIGPFLEGRYRLRELESSCTPYVDSLQVEPATRARAAYLLGQAQFLTDRIDAAAVTVDRALEGADPSSPGGLQLRTLRAEIQRANNVGSDRILAELDAILQDPALKESPTAMAEARRIAANLCWENGDLSAARHHGQLARTECQRLGLGRALAETNTYLSGILRDLGDLDQAEYLLRQGRAYFEAMGDPMQIAYAGYALGRILQLRGEHQASLDLGRSCLTQFERLGDDWGVAASRRLQGESLLAMGDVPAAEDQLRQALDFMRQRGFGDDIAALSEALARCLLLRGAVEAAVALCVDALASAGPQSRSRHHGPLLTTLAMARLAQGNLKLASELANDALAICRRSGSRAALDRALATVARVAATHHTATPGGKGGPAIASNSRPTASRRYSPRAKPKG